MPVGRDFPPVQTGPGTHPASCTMGTVSFPGVKYGRGVLLTSHPLLVPWSWKSRAIPLPTLWATTGPVTGTLYLFIFMHFGFAVAGGFQMSNDGAVSHSVTEKGVKQTMEPLPTFFVSVKLWLHSGIRIWAPSWSQRTLRA